MQAFKDSSGRLWEVVVDHGRVMQLKALLAIDVYGMIKSGLSSLADILGDIPQIINIAYVLCKDQADRLGVSDEQFGESLGGDALEDLIAAVQEAFIDFFPNRRHREMARAGLKIVTEMARSAALKTAQIKPELVAQMLLASLTSAPESSESTRPDSPSVR